MKLGQVALTVEDLSEAVKFHRDVLGLPLLFEYPNLAFFDLGGARLMLSAAGQAGESDGFILYYRVDDLNAAWQAVLERGGRAHKKPHLIAKMPDHELWMAYVRDPENRPVGLMSEVRS